MLSLEGRSECFEGVSVGHCSNVNVQVIILWQSSSMIAKNSHYLATIPTAFLTGIGGILGYRAFERWAYRQAITLTRPMELGLYVGFILVPFLIFVIGVDTKRWDPDYNTFSQEAKTDARRMWIRWAAYIVGSIAGYVLS